MINNRRRPVIALSGTDEDDVRFGALRAGADDFVSGANNWLELSSRIRLCTSAHHELLRTRAPARSGRAATEEGPIKVLMIDDSPLICKGIARQLSDERGLVFTYCTDPTEGLEIARRFAPTVLLLDLEMPRITGFELLKALREDPDLGDRPVVILSGNDDPAVKARAFAMGANDYVQKHYREGWSLEM